jgi:hypothetical protein
MVNPRTVGWFADGRPSGFFYFDSIAGRRLRPEPLNQERAPVAARPSRGPSAIDDPQAARLADEGGPSIRETASITLRFLRAAPVETELFYTFPELCPGKIRLSSEVIIHAEAQHVRLEIGRD